MSNFKPYQDWTPDDDDNDDEPLLRIIKLQQEQLSALRTVVAGIHEHQQLIVKHINQHHADVVEAMKAQFAYTEDVANIVRLMAGVEQ